MEKNWDLSWILNHLGEERAQYRHAVAPPVFQSSIFCFDSVADMREQLGDELANPFYTRGNNPTVEILRRKMAALEGAEDCLIFSSGIAAISAAVLSCVGQGSHVVCVRKPYGWLNKLLGEYLPRFGVETTFVDGREVDNFSRAINERTHLIYLESPNSLTFELQDIQAVATLAREKGIATICDNSYATPLNQKPIELGVDMVAHSASKYLNGHSDVVAGVLCASADRIRKIFEGEFMTLGGIISPHDAWLVIRGLRSLPLRVERVSKTTAEVVTFLEKHPRVSRVYYPMSPSHPQYELARRSFRSGGGLFSIDLVADDVAGVERFCDALERFLMTCSWGGYESLVFPICSLSSSENYAAKDLPFNLVRIYIGFEEPEVLIADLDQALSRI